MLSVVNFQSDAHGVIIRATRKLTAIDNRDGRVFLHDVMLDGWKLKQQVRR